MDASAGAKYMPLSKRYLKFFLIAFVVLLTTNAFAATSPIHWSGEKTVWDRKNNRVELFGDGTVYQSGESLQADYIILDLTNRTVDAKGHCIYVSKETLIRSQELHFNLDDSTGTVNGGTITNGAFLLKGERIIKLSNKHFRVYNAEYTTCRDCSSSWSFEAMDADFEIEGYAFMWSVTAKIKDAPVAWFPYLIVPIKKDRQSGLLFPRWGTATKHGFMYVQPFFWAISRSTDMTLGAGTYTLRGHRFEWEGRYMLSDHDFGQANFFYNRDKSIDSPTPNRWGVNLVQKQELPWGISEKFRFTDLSDSMFPVDFGDVSGRGDPVLVSDFSLSKATSDISTYMVLRRDRNLLKFDDRKSFDPRTVQLFPKVGIGFNNRPISDSSFMSGLAFDLSNFTRAAEPFDRDCEVSGTCAVASPDIKPGIDPIRETTRLAVTPSVYTTMRPFGILAVVPSLEYRSFFYSFHNSLQNLSRGYLLFRTEISIEFEKIVATNNPDIPRWKHLFRPIVKYARIPMVQQPSHPFMTQIGKRDGYNFDNYDIVPISTSPSLVNYKMPLGHSISYGFVTQIIHRRGSLKSQGADYSTFAELTAGQTFNILELRQAPDKRVPLSRLYSTFNLNLEKISYYAQYNYYPYLDRLLPTVPEEARSPHQLSTGISYNFSTELERVVQLSYAWSNLGRPNSGVNGSFAYGLSDYIHPSVSARYDFVTSTLLSVNYAISLFNPSRCWMVNVSGANSVDQAFSIQFDLSLNLMGTGYGGVTQVSRDTGIPF